MEQIACPCGRVLWIDIPRCPSCGRPTAVARQADAEEKSAAVCAPVPDALVPLLVEHPTWSPADAEAEREYRERFGHPSERSNAERR